MEERLKYILAQVIDWLKFAEAKNAALVGFTGAAILALIGAVKDIGNAAISYFIVHVTIPGLLIALFISLNSFRGILSKFFKHRAPAPGKDDHVFFYGDIHKYTDTQYLRKLYTLHDETAPEKFNRLEIELACQTIINSKVASRKFRLFNLGLNIRPLS
jgi:hypothetical protein